MYEDNDEDHKSNCVPIELCSNSFDIWTKSCYSWTVKVYITVCRTSSSGSRAVTSIDEIGESSEDVLRVTTKGYDFVCTVKPFRDRI